MGTSIKLIWQNVQKRSQQLFTRTLHVTKTRHAANSIRFNPRYFLDILVVNSHQLTNLLILAFINETTLNGSDIQIKQANLTVKINKRIKTINIRRL